MTTVWRIGYYPSPAPSARKLRKELGFGATVCDGRWHKSSSNKYLVYAGSSRALCQLEKRVHCNGVQPHNQALMRLDLPRHAVIEHAKDFGLKASWRDDEDHTQQLGMAWLEGETSLGLWVPSYVVEGEFNLLINPSHDDYDDISITVEVEPFLFDKRLF